MKATTTSPRVRFGSRGVAAAPVPSHGWRWALAGGLVGALLTLALFAPARWLAAAISQWTQGRLLLLHPRGTVWNGSAGVVLASGAGGAESIALPGRLDWHLRPRWNGAAATLDLPCCAARPLGVVASPTANGVKLAWQDGQSHWPAAMLTGLGAPFNTLKPMGSYRITLEGGPTPTLLVATREGSLQLSGSGRWNGRALRFNGEASAAPGSEAALANFLNIIGRRQGDRSLITLG